MPGRSTMGSSPAIWYAVPSGARQDLAVVSTASCSLHVPRHLPFITEDVETVSGSCAAKDSGSSFALLTQLLFSPTSSSSATFTGTTRPADMQKHINNSSNSSSNRQSIAFGSPQSRGPAALTCPPAPVRPGPSMILVPAEELHMYTSKECPPAFDGSITSWCM